MPPQKRKCLKSQTREIVSKVYDFMKKEALEKYAEKLTDARWRTSQATAVSESTITRILREKRAQTHTSSGLTSPFKNRKSRAKTMNIEDYDIGVIRRTIQNFQKEFNQTPSLMNLRNILKERIQFEKSANILRNLLLDLGYKWRKTENKGNLLVEKHEVQWSRFSYLKEIKALRTSGRPIVYTDESFIYTDNEQNKSLVEKDLSAEEKPKSTKAPRLIMAHAGSVVGFVPNALLIYNTDAKTGEYSDEMNSDNYLKWLETKLVPNLPKDAVVVIDNAAYHNTVSEKIPTLNSSKKEMQAWLTAKNIAYEDDFFRVELYDLIKKNKHKYKTYKVDELLKKHNFTVIRLPALHPDLNPMQNIWHIVRNYVVSNSDEPNCGPVLDTLIKGFDQVNKYWASQCLHVEKIEEEYMKYFELEFNVTITDTSDSESDDDDFEEQSDDSGSDSEML